MRINEGTKAKYGLGTVIISAIGVLFRAPDRGFVNPTSLDGCFLQKREQVCIEVESKRRMHGPESAKRLINPASAVSPNHRIKLVVVDSVQRVDSLVEEK